MMKKLTYLVLFNLGISVVALLSLYSYTQHMTIFSLFLAMALFGEIYLRAFLVEKIIKKDPTIKEQKIYKISEKLRGLCFIILTIGVLRIRLR